MPLILILVNNDNHVDFPQFYQSTYLRLCFTDQIIKWRGMEAEFVIYIFNMWIQSYSFYLTMKACLLIWHHLSGLWFKCKAQLSIFCVFFPVEKDCQF